jgi:hypothetical protein
VRKTLPAMRFLARKIFNVMKNNKMSRRKKVNFIIVTLLILLLTGWIIYGEQNRKYFYESQINSLVVSSSDSQKRSIDFYLADGTCINFMAPSGSKLLIGDSISKERDTMIFRVYRKGLNGEFHFYHEYDNGKME